MKQEIEAFIRYLKEVRHASENTTDSYERDLRKLEHYLSEQGISQVTQITATNLNSYILYLEKEGKKPSTICVHEGFFSVSTEAGNLEGGSYRRAEES